MFNCANKLMLRFILSAVSRPAEIKTEKIKYFLCDQKPFLFLPINCRMFYYVCHRGWLALQCYMMSGLLVYCLSIDCLLLSIDCLLLDSQSVCLQCDSWTLCKGHVSPDSEGTSVHGQERWSFNDFMMTYHQNLVSNSNLYFLSFVNKLASSLATQINSILMYQAVVSKLLNYLLTIWTSQIPREFKPWQRNKKMTVPKVST